MQPAGILRAAANADDAKLLKKLRSIEEMPYEDDFDCGLRGGGSVGGRRACGIQAHAQANVLIGNATANDTQAAANEKLAELIVNIPTAA
jgi:hypothetical protein